MTKTIIQNDLCIGQFVLTDCLELQPCKHWQYCAIRLCSSSLAPTINQDVMFISENKVYAIRSYT